MMTQMTHPEVAGYNEIVAEAVVIKAKYALAHPEATPKDFTQEIRMVSRSGAPESWLRAVQATTLARTQPSATRLFEAIGCWEEFLKQMAALDRKKYRSLQSVRDLASLTLGQLYYEKKDYQKTISTLAKVAPESSAYPDAMKTKSWAHLMIRDYARAEGISYNFQLDSMVRTYAPDVILVTGISFFENCRYSSAIKSSGLFFSKYHVLHEWLAHWQKTHEDPYEIALKFLKKDGSIPFEAGVRLVTSPSFVASQNELNLLFDEDTLMNELVKSTLLRSVAVDFTKRRAFFEANAMAGLRKALTDRLVTLNKDLEVNSELAQLLEVDSQNRMGERTMQAYANRDKAKPVAGAKPERSPAEAKHIGLSWANFTAQTIKHEEVWEDELEFLKADISNDCKAPAARK